MAAIFEAITYLLPPLLITSHLLVSPYTKVEESFSLQATHDILRYGLPTQNITEILPKRYDHFYFPGVVPRSFVGPLLLSQVSEPFRIALGGVVNDQIIVRGTLGLLTSLSLVYYTYRIRRTFGTTAARFYSVLQATQFHLPYYASRTLPNTFALIFTTAAHGLFLTPPGTSPRAQRNSIKLGILLLTLSSIVFRSELALLLATTSVHFLLARRITPRSLIAAGLAGAVVGLTATLLIDSYFWLTPFSSKSRFTTPILTDKTGLIWPELSAFIYNTVEGKASSWGTSPWHYYFTNSLPKLLLNPIWLVTIPVALYTSTRPALSLLSPGLCFIGVYSFIPHKEWRFIEYTIPPLTLLSSLGASFLFNRRTKSFAYSFLSICIIASIPASAFLATSMSFISSQNYPGGRAISILHEYVPRSTFTRVHIDTYTCMTGASRFLQEAPLWEPSSPPSRIDWDKTEDTDVRVRMPGFWRSINVAVVHDPERTIGKYEIKERVKGLKGIKILRPGQELEEERKWVGFGVAGWWIGVEVEVKLVIAQRIEGVEIV